MGQLQIISEGFSEQTKVFVDNVEIDGVRKIEIEPITADNPVVVHITVEMVNLGRCVDRGE